jgi:hypothetical protein
VTEPRVVEICEWTELEDGYFEPSCCPGGREPLTQNRSCPWCGEVVVPVLEDPM